MNEAQSFGAWVKQQRRALDLTQQDLATFVGCSESAIIKIETGKRRPSRQIAERLMIFLEIPPEEQAPFLNLARNAPGPAQFLAAPPAPRPTNLPARRTSLVGREREIARVLDCLRREPRIVTLVGPGGIGKTRLGLEVATQLLEAFRDGVFFVPLAPISDPALVLSAVAQALVVREAASQPLLDTLKHYLSDKQTLLLLDNFEQVTEAAPLLGELLVSAPDLKLLVTSRSVLNVYGEQQYIVPPLNMPDREYLSSLNNLLEYEAVRLFVDRARLVNIDFDVGDDRAQAEAVAEICHRLDGLPLAIELAAARVNLLSPTAMLGRLESRLGLLTGGPRDLPLRQQTLRSAIDWSYDLLDDADKQLFRRLSAFVGGCTLAAVEAVCLQSSSPPAQTLSLVESLVSKSLLRQSEGAEAEPRFWMLETIQEYARETLLAVEGDEAEALAQRHAAYYLALAEEAEPELAGAGQAAWLARLENEHDNLRAALRFARDTGDAMTALRIAGALWRFWLVHGYYSEGREQLAAALRMADATVKGSLKSAYAKALIGAGVLAWRQNDFDAARSFSEQSLKLYRQLGEAGRWGVAQSLHSLGNVAHRHGDYPVAQTYFEESLAIRRDLGDQRGMADSLNNLALVVDEQGDYNRALALYEESLTTYKELGDKRGIANSLNNQGFIAWEKGDYAYAAALYEESLPLYRELGDRRGIANALTNLALVAWKQQDLAAALSLYEESLSIYRDLEDKHGIADCVEGLARVAGSQGKAEHAARLWGAAEAQREAIGIAIPPGDLPEYEQNVARSRETLPAPAWEAAWAAGRAMSVEQAIAYALRDV
ncbi:MAG: tetratricopeptide repeat protein [Chloroflexia bacterium]